MHYAWWAIVAMGAYGVTVVCLKLALKSVPPEVALVVTNSMLVIAGVGLVLFRGESIGAHIGLSRQTLYLAIAGLTLSVSIVSYYLGLSRGPASVVAPVFALHFAIVAVLGFLVLGEELKVSRVLGILVAGAAVVLLTR